MADQSLLSVEDLVVAYNGIRALQGISLEVRPGEIVALIGANGAGKSTLLRAISGLTPIKEGSIRFDGKTLNSVPAHKIVAMGIAHVPEGRGIFANLTVLENLKLATVTWPAPMNASSRCSPACVSERNSLGGRFPAVNSKCSQSAGRS